MPTRWSSFASHPRTTASHGRCSMRWSRTPSGIYKLLISLIGSSILFQVSHARHEIPIYCQCYIFHISDPIFTKFTVYNIMYENKVTCDIISNFYDCKYVNPILAYTHLNVISRKSRGIYSSCTGHVHFNEHCSDRQYFKLIQ